MRDRERESSQRDRADLALLDKLADRRDLAEALRRLADPDDESLAYEEIRRELRLD